MLAYDDKTMTVEFHQIDRWGDVPAGSLITDGSESFVVRNDPRSARVTLLNLHGEPVKRFKPEEQIDHDVWRSTRF